MSTAVLEEQLAVKIVRVVLFVVATVGNGFIIFLIFKSKKMRKEKFNLLIVLLAIGDIVLGMSALLRASQKMITNGHYTRLRCLALGSPFLYGAHIAQLAMFLIAMDRLDTIFRLHKKHVQGVYFLYVLSIPFVLVVSLIPVAFLFYGIEDHDVKYCMLFVNWTKKFGTFTFFEMICLNISILALYAVIFLLYHHKTKHLTNTPRNHFQSIVYGVVTIYLLTWCLPKWIMFGLKIANADKSLVAWLSFIVGISEVFSACLNVIVYGYTHRDLRKSMREFCLKHLGYSIPIENQRMKMKKKTIVKSDQICDGDVGFAVS
ncbi:hypothetical protein QR680_019029 [Steinernema hermaphroditum]|uniref:G-protein coupled receptors family 1 profile domain-containing protein n=1 Tax=Steinernema hermaphroditum TaxID=289476 RepID=A0AA39HLX5_9BILA|nr:hypothetical protein QR680_019029 [Steinernema hermaphroditum]